MKRILLATALLAFAGTAHAQSVFVNDGTLIEADGTRTTGDILIRNGKVIRQAENIPTPQSVTVIEGGWVGAGLFASISSLGLQDLGSRGSDNDTRANADTSLSERAADSFNPKSVSVANTRRRGITHALTVQDASGDSIFAGTGALVSLSSDYDSVVDADAFIHVAMGESGANRAGGSRAAALAQLRRAINESADDESADANPVLTGIDRENLRRALRGDIPMVVSANRAADLLVLVGLKNENPRLDIIVIGATEAWDVADELARAGIKVVIDPVENLPKSFESVGARNDNILLLDAAGVDYAIANLSSLGVTKPAALAQHAGNAVGYGLSWDKAWVAVTTTPMSWFDSRSDTLVVWDNDPLEATSAPVYMFIDGKEHSLESRQTALRDRYNPSRTDDPRPYKYRN